MDYKTMPQDFIDLYSAKGRVFDALRDGIETLSGLLVRTQLPEATLRTALRLLEEENKVQLVSQTETDDQAFKLPLSGFWPFSRR